MLMISIHALCEEGDASRMPQVMYPEVFLSTPSARRATHFCFGSPHCVVISIHALCEEGDHLRPGGFRPVRYFYPRPLRGGRHNAIIGKMEAAKFLSTPSARRATLLDQIFEVILMISIHALCEEGDLVHPFPTVSGFDFYPRPLRGGRQILFGAKSASARFLSTPSARRATSTSVGCVTFWFHFYPRPLRGGRPAKAA